MEVIEHGPPIQKRFVATAASLVKPGGLLLVSTLNRTLKSFALAIVRRRICAALARARHTPLGAIRDAARPLTGFARAAGPKGARSLARNRLRSVLRRDLAPLVRYGRELPIRPRRSRTFLEPKLNRRRGAAASGFRSEFSPFAVLL